ncbi:MAG TPA: PC4/YdbC family ssDNA-binding protein [Polyangiaceae bacterium]|jgi:hypothetical protein
MSDLEHVLCTIERGEHGAIRVARKTYNGSAPFTDVRFFYKDGAGELKPTAKGTSIRDSELHQVLDALAKVAKKIESGASEPRAVRTSHAQRSIPVGTREVQPIGEDPDPPGLF